MTVVAGTAARTESGPADVARIDPDSPGALERLQAAFEEALGWHPEAVCESSYTLAGRPVRTRIVGRALAAQLGPPLAHLRSERQASADIALSIDLWDACETGVACPVRNSRGRPGGTWQIPSGLLTASPDGRHVRYQRPHALTWLDRQAERIIGWRACGGLLSLDERGKPLAPLLSIWLSDRDVYVVHGGLVALAGQGVLITGPAGAGKSTTTLACLGAGFGYLGDDHSGLQARDRGSFLGHSLYGSARLEPDHVARFPALADAAIEADDPGDDKSLLMVSNVYPEQVERSAEVRALALPRIVDADHSLVRPASKGEALRRIAPSSLLTLLSPGASGLDRLTRLVQQVPCYWLELGRDLDEIPVHVEELLARSAG